MSLTAERMLAAMKAQRISYATLQGLTGVPKSALQRYATGATPKIPADRLKAIADALQCSTSYLLGETDRAARQEIINQVAIAPTGSAPVVGTIRAGMPIAAKEDILGWLPVDVRNPEEYFWLVVEGDSMQGAGILPGSKVLIHRQSTAENGNIVACRLNGDDATLKRFQQKGDTIVLLPENQAYQPIILSAADFACGDAEIIGVASVVMNRLL